MQLLLFVAARCISAEGVPTVADDNATSVHKIERLHEIFTLSPSEGPQVPVNRGSKNLWFAAVDRNGIREKVARKVKALPLKAKAE
ncbi:hypothetical protein ACIOVF_04325 [Pseudomonas sp. NPDC087612]|uniref:hypothetical protein n=1 Tax=unclassified Pseudomonas TaxID=196821 RepID=UPI001BCF0D30|nr:MULTISPECIES: hypothetical protein [unclassified Pseudomonas]QVM95569.1 hypothetical protein JYG36_21060 [Pseudomonas sp. SORT22]UVL57577.1 hypothetical protein LOY22_06250 [Pseudomonas sp. B21-035]UVL62888.1 hypothetical protein LOY54_06340 [Pseudomonas sp. B21-032]